MFVPTQTILRFYNVLLGGSGERNPCQSHGHSCLGLTSPLSCSCYPKSSIPGSQVATPSTGSGRPVGMVSAGAGWRGRVGLEPGGLVLLQIWREESLGLGDQEVCTIPSPPLRQPELEGWVQLPVRAREIQNTPVDPSPLSAYFHQHTPKGNLAHSFQAVKSITFPRSPDKKAHVSWLSCSKELSNGAVSAW